ncbi:DUF6343 family protein [Quadrisphaera sp. INWT6]|uniref:DUF6343 family protein n=1 Tax=Quadrisphaera sp. INWT6 TaxID=2596917 RepID=UPI0018921EE5|nr:DUF6343 family protein [Quadrisphaera sp. INWT6]
MERRRGSAGQGPGWWGRGGPSWSEQHGGPPVRSALTLRLVLAAFGLLLWGGASLWVAAAGGPTWLLLLTAFAAVGFAVDLVVVARRKRRGEPG